MLSKTWVLAALGFVLAGCGGSGAAGGGTPNNLVRRNVNGDTFNYTVGGTYSQSGVVTNATTTGTATDIYTSDTYNGAGALQDVIATTIAVQSGSQTFTDSKQYDPVLYTTLAQSDSGTLNTGVLQAVTSGAFTPPATLTSATRLNTTEVLADGTQVSILYSVSGSESVLALNGTTYDCWIIQRQVVFSDGLTSVATIDFSPFLGAAIKVVQTDTYSSGNSDTLTSTLVSYTEGISPEKS